MARTSQKVIVKFNSAAFLCTRKEPRHICSSLLVQASGHTPGPPGGQMSEKGSPGGPRYRKATGKLRPSLQMSTVPPNGPPAPSSPSCAPPFGGPPERRAAMRLPRTSPRVADMTHTLFPSTRASSHDPAFPRCPPHLFPRPCGTPVTCFPNEPPPRRLPGDPFPIFCQTHISDPHSHLINVARPQSVHVLVGT